MDKEKWKILVVDDDKDVLFLTGTILSDFKFEGKALNILYAESAQTAKNLLIKNPDLSFVLLDAVMETNHTGLDLVRYIRQDLNYQKVRIMLRTGYPVEAPEQMVIQNFDINDYEIKSDLTPEKLISKLTIGLRSFSAINKLHELEAELIKTNKKINALNEELTDANTELKQSKEQTTEAILKLEIALESSKSDCWEMDLVSGTLTYTERWAKLLGYKHGEIDQTIEAVMTIIHPDDIPGNQFALQNYIEGKTAIYESECRLKTKSGNWVWVSTRGQANKWDNVGRPVNLIGINYDITDRKNIELALKDNKEKVRILFDTMTEGLALNEIVYNEQGEMIDYRILEVNNAFYNIADYSNQQVIGSLATNLYGMTSESIKAFWMEHKKKDITTYTEFKSPLQNRIFYISTSPFSNDKFVTTFFDITSIKKTEKLLIESEDRNRSILHTAMDGFFRTSKKGRLLEVNETYCKMSGYSEKELLSMSIPELDANESEIEAAKHMQKIIEFGKDRFETFHRRKDGSVYEVESSVQYKSGDDGYFVAFIRDITEKRQTEEKLAKNNKLLQEFMDNSPAIIYMVDTEGRYITMNRKLETLFGKKSEEIVGLKREDIIPKEIAKQHFQNDQKVIREGKPLTFEEDNIEPDGKHFYFTIKFPLFDNQNKIYGVAGISTDITERKRTEIDLFESEKKYRNLFNNAQVAMFRTKYDGSDILDFNEKYLKIFELDRNEMKASSAKKYWADQDQRKEMIRHLDKNESVTDFECRMLTKSGNVRTCLTSAHLYKDLGILEGSIIDITERKLAEGKLRESEHRYRSLFENMQEGFAHCQMIFENNKPVDFIYLAVNDKFELLTGLKNVTGKKVSELIPGIIHTDDEILKIYGRVSKSRQPEKFEYYLNALQQWLSISVYSPQENYFVAVFDVITERKEAENALRDSNQRYRTFFEQGHDGIVVIDPETASFLEFNDQVCKQLGYTRKEFSGLKIFDIEAAETKEQTKEHIRKIISHGNDDFETIQKTKKGEIRDISVSARVIEIENRKVYHCIWRDITNLKRYEIELIRAKEIAEENEKKFRFLTETILDVIWIMDIETMRFTYVSPSVEKLRGFTVEEVLSQSAIESLTQESQVYLSGILPERIQKGLAGIEENYVDEIEQPCKDGSTVWTEVISYFSFNSERKLEVIGTSRNIKDRKIAEQSLRESEERYKSAVLDLNKAQSLSKVGSWKWYIQENRLEWSDEMYQIFGIDRNSFTGRLDEIIQQRIHPDDIAKVDASNNSVSEKGVPYPVEYRIIIPDKTIKTVWAEAGELIKDKNSKPIILTGIVQDITERKQSEEALHESETRYAIIFDQSPLALEFYGADGALIKVNDAGLKTFGVVDVNDIKNWNLFEDPNVTVEQKNKLHRGETIKYQVDFDFEIVKKLNLYRTTKSGIRIFDVLISHLGIGYIAQIQDITERKQAEDGLNQKTALLEAQLYSSIDGILIVDPLGKKILQNQQVIDLWKIPKEIAENTDDSVQVNHVMNMTVNPDQFVEKIKYLYEHPLETSYDEVELINGTILDRYSAPILGKDGRNYGRIWVFRNITHRKHTELELIKAKEKAEESDRLKTSFLQNMSHEIRTPMNAIMGFSELLIRQFNNKPKLEYYTNIIIQRGKDLLEIINEILDIAKIETGQLTLNFERCELGALSSELEVVFKEQKRRQFKSVEFWTSFRYEQDSSVIITDIGKLRQIFINLIENAFKFTEKGKIVAGCMPDIKNNLVFYVSDTGIGIPEDKQSLIFERFSQVNPELSRIYGGAGLGLSIVKGLLNLLKGEIFLESEPGKGTTFYFTFPYQVSQLEPSKIEIPVVADNFTFSVGTILIVEDDEYNAAYLNEILTDSGLKILHTRFGKEAVSMALENEIDIVLMDIRLPDISGFEAATQIKKIKPQLKIVAQTAYAASSDREKALKSGCDDYISKPIILDELMTVINKYLNDK